MSADGLWYLPEGFREAARANVDTAEAAENARRYLGQVQVNAASYGGAGDFVNALTTTRDAQARGVAHAAEGRQNMAAADNQVAELGEGVDAAAGQALGAAAASVQARVPADRTVADGL
ncbi:hypothetical protein E1265_28580 [Streptomyces sp. 8K308]|uniref:hypothetical protein n=1 Tax=Streptomyces sp. 8K308 TaxID=2530388 RepID=UPI00104C4803|nr:hypothetical protein [Streptomyces sp. 8K308]TDC13081.1 hypothetical protein E1265_28580 [Streptomyces sp. 8K308]